MHGEGNEYRGFAAYVQASEQGYDACYMRLVTRAASGSILSQSDGPYGTLATATAWGFGAS